MWRTCCAANIDNCSTLIYSFNIEVSVFNSYCICLNYLSAYAMANPLRSSRSAILRPYWCFVLLTGSNEVVLEWRFSSSDCLHPWPPSHSLVDQGQMKMSHPNSKRDSNLRYEYKIFSLFVALFACIVQIDMVESNLYKRLRL